MYSNTSSASHFPYIPTFHCMAYPITGSCDSNAYTQFRNSYNDDRTARCRRFHPGQRCGEKTRTVGHFYLEMKKLQHLWLKFFV